MTGRERPGPLSLVTQPAQPPNRRLLLITGSLAGFAVATLGARILFGARDEKPRSALAQAPVRTLTWRKEDALVRMRRVVNAIPDHARSWGPLITAADGRNYHEVSLLGGGSLRAYVDEAGRMTELAAVAVPASRVPEKNSWAVAQTLLFGADPKAADSVAQPDIIIAITNLIDGETAGSIRSDRALFHIEPGRDGFTLRAVPAGEPSE